MTIGDSENTSVGRTPRLMAEQVTVDKAYLEALERLAVAMRENPHFQRMNPIPGEAYYSVGGLIANIDRLRPKPPDPPRDPVDVLRDGLAILREHLEHGVWPSNNDWRPFIADARRIIEANEQAND